MVFFFALKNSSAATSSSRSPVRGARTQNLQDNQARGEITRGHRLTKLRAVGL